MRFPVLDGGRPGDKRGFIHKKLLGGIGKIAGILPIPGAGIISTVARTLAGSGRTGQRPNQLTAQEKELARGFKFGGGGGGGVTRVLGGEIGACLPGFRPDFVTGVCEPAAGQVLGEATLGQYGAGMVPGIMQISRGVCARGMLLGNDGICYNKGQISNRQRMWPAGRKPLLSGGDMRAISIAARAGKRMEGATKRLQRLGMMKKPVRRGSSTQHSRLLEAHVTK